VKKVVIVLKMLLAVCLMGVISAALSGCGSSGTSNNNITNSSASTTNSAAQTTTTSAANIGNSSVSAVPSVSSVLAGGTFDVSIVVNTNSPTRGLQFVLNWDPTKVQCVSTEPGNYLSDFAAANNGDVFYLPSSPSFDNASGRFPKDTNTNPSASPIFQNAILSGAPGPNGTYLGVMGSGSVYVLHMSALAGASGTVNFKLSEVILGDTSSPKTLDMHAVINNGTITINP
jgi:Cohesin domain